MSKKYIIIIFCLSFMYVDAQNNLIPNPSFEKYKKIMNTWSFTTSDFDNTTVAWSSPNNATPDIFVKNTATEWWYNKHGWAIDSIADKNRMLGLILYTSSPASLNYREYAQCKLIAPLEKNVEYRLTYKIKLGASSNLAVNNVGIYLSNTFVPKQPNADPIPLKPQLNTTDIVGKDKKWRELTYEFKASDNFQYLIVGNFYNNSKTKYDSVSNGFKSQKQAYYYFDDFNLSPITSIVPKIADNINKDDLTSVFNPANLFFEVNNADIPTLSKLEIDKIANYLIKNEIKRLVIHGYTDSKGTSDYNLKLSSLRACNIKDYLIQKGIAGNRLECIGHGEQNNNEIESAQRKVVFDLK